MASRRGIMVTIAALAAITAASFLVWLPGPDTGTTLVITDHREYLDGVKNIHEVLSESISIEFSKMLDGETTPADYIEISETTSSQVTSQVGEFIASKPPAEWQESYIRYGDALKSFSAYVTETKVLASAMIEGGDGGIPPEQLQTALERIEALAAEADHHAEASDAARPAQ